MVDADQLQLSDEHLRQQDVELRRDRRHAAVHRCSSHRDGTGATITPTTLTASGQGFTVTGLTDTALTTNITVVDSSTPQLQQVVTITCPTGSSSPAMAVEPAGGYTYAIAVADPTPPPATLANGCSTKQSNFVITGGTPPYTACVLGPEATVAPSISADDDHARRDRASR